MKRILGGGIFLLCTCLYLVCSAQSLPGEGATALDVSPNNLAPLLPGPAIHSVSPEERTFFSRAKDQFDQDQYQLAFSHANDFIAMHPESPLLPDAYLLLGEIYAHQNDLHRAAEGFNTFLEKFPAESRTSRVHMRLSDIYFQLDDLSSIQAIWEDMPGQEESKKKIYDRLAQSYIDRQAYLEALGIMMKRREISRDPVDNTLVRHKITLLIRENLQADALQSVVKRFGSEYPSDEAMIRLISLYDLKGDYYREEREIRGFLKRFPNHFFKTQARQLLDRLKDKIKSDRYLIAVILPLSDQLRLFGNKALSGAELAVQLFKEALPTASVGLVVRDSEDDPSRLRMTIEDWLNEYQPIAVVGPLLSREVNQLAPILERRGLPLITPGATARNLVSLGSFVYRNAVTNRFLCNSIAEYAVLQLEIERFAVLYPEERLGQRWVDCFSSMVSDLGGEVVLVESYPLDNTDFSNTILRLKKADLEKDGFMEDVEKENGGVEKLYTPGFEAIFLPADAVRAGLIIPQLFFHNFNDVRILGTNSWNSPEFLKLAGPYAEGAIFADGFFLGSADPHVKGFIHEYRTRFKDDPDLFSAQAFDATRLVLAALRGGAGTPLQVKTAIAGAIDFPGVSGFIYEILEGELIKEPFYIEVRGGEFVQVN